MLDDDVVLLFVIRDLKLIEEEVGGLADDHGGEELTAKPGTTAGRDRLFYNSDPDGGVLAELVSAGEASGAGPDDDHVGVGVADHVGHVPTSHLPGDDGFLDRFKAERVQV